MRHVEANEHSQNFNGMSRWFKSTRHLIMVLGHFRNVRHLSPGCTLQSTSWNPICSGTLVQARSCDIEDGSKHTNEDEGINTLHRSVSNDPHVPQIATAANCATWMLCINKDSWHGCKFLGPIHSPRISRPRKVRNRGSLVGCCRAVLCMFPILI